MEEKSLRGNVKGYMSGGPRGVSLHLLSPLRLVRGQSERACTCTPRPTVRFQGVSPERVFKCLGRL